MSIVYDELDPDVVPMVEFFNSNGLPTNMSCQGHNRSNMSMFWIRFTKDVTEEDVVRFQRKFLNKYGAFTSCGRFAQRIISFGNCVDKRWEYMAATVEAAQCDLKAWKSCMPYNRCAVNRYRKKPVEIEAIQWTGDNISDICKFTGLDMDVLVRDGVLYIETLEGEMRATCGDYIIKGVKGEFYPCQPDIFEETYNLAGGVI